MATEKRFHPKLDIIQPLVSGFGGCFASDLITVHGHKVGYMYREDPDPEEDHDSGWRFLAGFESQQYLDDEDNVEFLDVNTVANCDPEIIPLLKSPVGSTFERDKHTGQFVETEDDELDEDDDDSDGDDEDVDDDDANGGAKPPFPVIHAGDYRFSEEWQLTLPFSVQRRIEEGSLVLWRPQRPRLTFWIDVWGNDHDETLEERLKWLIDGSSPKRRNEGIVRRDGIILFTYELIEAQEGGEDPAAPSLYAFAIGPASHVQMAVYADDLATFKIGEKAAGSVRPVR